MLFAQTVLLFPFTPFLIRFCRLFLETGTLRQEAFLLAKTTIRLSALGQPMTLAASLLVLSLSALAGTLAVKKGG